MPSKNLNFHPQQRTFKYEPVPKYLQSVGFTVAICPAAGKPGEETPHMKRVGMLVVSLRGVNFRFWSHLGCSGQNAIIFSREGLF